MAQCGNNSASALQYLNSLSKPAPADEQAEPEQQADESKDLPEQAAPEGEQPQMVAPGEYRVQVTRNGVPVEGVEKAAKSKHLPPLTPSPEALVSWSVKYWTPSGYDAQLTIRVGATAEDLKSVMGLAETALRAMGERGCKPQIGKGKVESAEGNHEEAPPLCGFHKTPMVKRQSKQGGFFWSCPQKLDNGEWCSYRPPKQQA
ncbi:MAG: hypothetical protein FJ015_07115 [Chloroflexi bacterium]|nr:hypothetical protein [Chloroflexota bacterium]